jgi:AcrR family transcriptional regulator
MPVPDAPRGRTGRPAVTSRAEILTGARRIIDRDGWEKLTVRRLAAELGIGATTLYHHVRDRQDLLITLLDEHAAQTLPLELPEDPRDRIVVGATAMRNSLTAWPWAAEVLTADGFVARIGASGLRVVEGIVSGAVELGCRPEQAVDVFRSVWYLTVGEILVRAHSRPPEERSVPGEPFFAGLDPTRTPVLAEIGDRWPELAARDVYPTAIRALVEGLLTAQATER